MPDRVTEADLARWEKTARQAISKTAAPSNLAAYEVCQTAVPALVAEVRRLRQVIEIVALACEDHGAPALAREIREAERKHVLRPEEGNTHA